jgi:hypothetical protein
LEWSRLIRCGPRTILAKNLQTKNKIFPLLRLCNLLQHGIICILVHGTHEISDLGRNEDCLILATKTDWSRLTRPRERRRRKGRRPLVPWRRSEATAAAPPPPRTPPGPVRISWTCCSLQIVSLPGRWNVTAASWPSCWSGIEAVVAKLQVRNGGHRGYLLARNETHRRDRFDFSVCTGTPSRLFLRDRTALKKIGATLE